MSEWENVQIRTKADFRRRTRRGRILQSHMKKRRAAAATSTRFKLPSQLNLLRALQSEALKESQIDFRFFLCQEIDCANFRKVIRPISNINNHQGTKPFISSSDLNVHFFALRTELTLLPRRHNAASNQQFVQIRLPSPPASFYLGHGRCIMRGKRQGR